MKNYTPTRDALFGKNYVSYRRLWLDAGLQACSAEMQGIVVDLGGKRKNKRGSFRPPEEQALAWWYLNLDWNTAPDIYSDVAAVPLKTGSVDVVICTEVLEHLPEPGECVGEMYRILREGGMGFASVPFLYPVHPDPFDFQRFSPDGLSRLFRSFSSIEIVPMGGFLGTLGMFIDLGLYGLTGRNRLYRLLIRFVYWFSKQLCALDLTLRPLNSTWQNFTTGYLIRVMK